jgi:hypothetical protein
LSAGGCQEISFIYSGEIMQPVDNIVQINEFKRDSQQELVDDIGARAFLFLRDAAEEMGVPIKTVITEHILGLALVMRAVEGKDEALSALNDISKLLDNA